MWSPYGVWLGEFIFPCIPRWTPDGLQMDSRWTPDGLQVDSRWTLDKELAGLTPKKKRSKVHMESTWNLWLRVKSSQFPLYSVQILPECQIPRSVQRNSGTQAGFRAEYQGESKDLEHCHTLGLPNLLPKECPECTQRKDGGDVLPEPDEGYYTSIC